MNRPLAAALTLLVVFACAFCSRSKAATPLPAPPPSGWCFDSFTAPNYNGVRACENTPPPLDPGAYRTLSVTWLGDDRLPHTIDVTLCENLWGRMNYGQSPNLGWPYRTATVKWQKTDSRYLRCRLKMPANPGTISHYFKSVTYQSTIPVRMAFVTPGAPWPTGARTGCFWPSPDVVLDRPALNINPGAPNSVKCSVPAMFEGDVLIDSEPGQRGWIGIANY